MIKLKDLLPINEAKFSKDQIEIMKMAYGTLSGMNPSSPTYKKFIKFLDKLPKDQLKQLAGANIKFISILAKNRLRGESINEAKEIKFHQIQPKDYIWYRSGIQYFVTKTGPNVLHMGLVNKGKPGSGGSLFASNTKLTRKNFDSQIRVKFIKKITRDKNTLWQESVNEDLTPLRKIYADLDKKFPKYNHKKISDVNKVVKFLKRKLKPGSQLPDFVASFYNDYRGGEDITKNHKRFFQYTGKMLKKKESVKEAGMGILTTDQSDVLQGIVLRNKNKNLKAILKCSIKKWIF
jgi:hypothetical protein